MKAATLGRAVAAVVVVALIVIGIITVWPSSNAGPAVVTPDPSSSASITGTPTATTPSTQPASSAPTERTDLEKRVLAFEEAYRLFDPEVRKKQLKPYVTDEFFDSLFPEDESESDYLRSLREGKSQSLDLDTALVSIEHFNHDEDLLEVFTQITQTVRDGESVTSRTVNHTSYWVQTQSGVWKAQSDSIN